MSKVSKTIALFRHDLDMGCIVAGCDEAGRGPLAGPVVCAACSLPLDTMIDGIFDSKCVSESRREVLFQQIVSKATSFKISIIDNKIIDEINILNATKRGMKQAVEAVMSELDARNIAQSDGSFSENSGEISAGYADYGRSIMLVDAVRLDVDFRTMPLIKGDAKSYNIAAASILAKVARDEIMRELHHQFPQYNFAKNKGYGTAEHIRAIKDFGATPHHRTSFIKKFI